VFLRRSVAIDDRGFGVQQRQEVADLLGGPEDVDGDMLAVLGDDLAFVFCLRVPPLPDAPGQTPLVAPPGAPRE